MGNSIKGSKARSQNDSSIIYHFLYIYIDDDNSDELSSVTNILLNIIVPNIPELKKNGIYVEVFQLNKQTLKNKELIKLLKKNGILKLPVLKIHNGSENMLIVGANQIIEYYNKYLGLTIPQQRPQQRPQQPPQQRPQPVQRPPQPNRAPIEEEEYDDLPIGSNKNMTSKLDEMIKFREMSKQGYKNNNHQNSRRNIDNDSSNSNSTHSKSTHSNSKHSNSTHSTHSKQKYTSTITNDDLKDSPFREGDFLNDGLDNNLDDSLDENIASYSSALLSSKSNPKTNAYSNMGDDEADDEKDELMIRAFWDNNFND